MPLEEDAPGLLPEDAPELRASSRQIVRWRWFALVIALLGLVAGLAYALEPSLGWIAPLFHAPHRIRAGWIAAAAFSQLLMYVGVAGILQSGLRGSLPSDSLPPADARSVGVAAAFLWTNRAFPGPAIAGLATLIFLLGRRSVPSAAAQAAAATFYLSDYISFTALSVLLLVALAIHGGLAGLNPVVLSLALVSALGAMALTVFLLRSPALVTRLSESLSLRLARLARRRDAPALSVRARGVVEGFFARWKTIAAHPTALWSAVGWAFFMHCWEIATVLCGLLAFAPRTAARDILRLALGSGTGYVAGNLAAIISFLPAGIGIFETAMVAALHLIGRTPEDQALWATLLYRFLSVWLPLPLVLRTARHAVRSVAGAMKSGAGS